MAETDAENDETQAVYVRLRVEELRKEMEARIHGQSKKSGRGSGGMGGKIWLAISLMTCAMFVFAIGDIIYTHFTTLANPVRAAKHNRMLALSGDADAQTEYGVALLLGHGVSKDAQAAIGWLRKAASSGNVDAQFWLGYAYDKGEGVSKDSAEAAKWYRKAAERGHGVAQNNLAVAFEEGDGVPKDITEAMKWYRRAAEQGEVNAQFALGYAYTKGDGVEQDNVEAVKWYRKAAAQGHDLAQNNLAYAYENGEGISKDSAEAVKWYRKSAEQGNLTAQKNIGFTYIERGNGLEGLAWYYFARSNCATDDDLDQTILEEEKKQGRHVVPLARQRTLEIAKEIANGNKK
jgi:TPR repeat protein